MRLRHTLVCITASIAGGLPLPRTRRAPRCRRGTALLPHGTPTRLSSCPAGRGWRGPRQAELVLPLLTVAAAPSGSDGHPAA